MKKKLLFLLSSFIIISLACSFSGNDTVNNSRASLIATAVAGTQEAERAIIVDEVLGDALPEEIILDPILEPDYLLANTLYYFSETSPDLFQVFRLERDGVVSTQVTNEPGSIKNFTVNQIDGRVAYVFNNQIFVINPDGSNRQLLVNGGPVDESSGVYSYLESIGGLAWSPDGNILAYGRGGINFYNFGTGTSSLLLPNVTFVYPGGGGIGPEQLFHPSAWFQDGSKLLVSVGWMEGGTLSVFNPATSTNTVLGHGITCCDYDISGDGSKVLVGSPVLGLIESGLWSFNANNGVETVFLPTTAPDGSFNFAGWPKELPNGDLVYFYANLLAPPEFSNTALTMVHTAADGITGLFNIRPESWEITDALWDLTGDNVVIVQPSADPYSYPRRGPIVLVDTLGGPIMTLVPSGYGIQWGP